METPIITINEQGFSSVTIDNRQFSLEQKLPSMTCPKCYKDGGCIEGHMIPCSVSWCRESINRYHGGVATGITVGDFRICGSCLRKTNYT